MIRKEEGGGGGGGGAAAVTHRHLRQRPACEEEEPLGCRRSQLSVEEEKAGGEGAVKGRSCGDSCSDETQNFSADADSAAEDAAEAAEAAEASSASHQMQVIRPHCSNSDTCSPTPSCRICFQGAEQGALLNPCRCDGSVRYTHQHCLLKWISERGSWTCELCCYRFQVIAVNMKRPWQWQSISITLVEKVQIIAVFLGSLFLVSSVSWLLWSALSPQAVWQRRDVLFQICYGMYGFMDLVCVGLIVHEGAAVYNVFLRWRAVNLHWDVQSYDKTSDLEDLSTGRPLLGPRTLWLPLDTLSHPGPLDS
ncbi:E3 ubiquitin-protein ligase MARCH11, partial [Cynoglossus semilaevis]|uniref:E3 ubiquitin-protein ligase MARCH11 n=1 Tax=Cynoglossus semilaevis TaxID=244447 RepID=UPI0007DCAACB